jgi:hypothetical protein
LVVDTYVANKFSGARKQFRLKSLLNHLYVTVGLPEIIAGVQQIEKNLSIVLPQNNKKFGKKIISTGTGVCEVHQGKKLTMQPIKN